MKKARASVSTESESSDEDSSDEARASRVVNQRVRWTVKKREKGGKRVD